MKQYSNCTVQYKFKMIPIVFILALILLSLYLYVKWAHSYWQRKSVEYLEPNFFFGNIDDSIGASQEIHRCEAYKNFYNHFKKKGVRYGGLYTYLKPILIPIDLDLVKSILMTDFTHFVNHDGFVNPKVSPLQGNLFNLRDDKWKKMRSKLTPTFTSGKMKIMFGNLIECSSNLEKLLNDLSSSNEPINIRNVLIRFSTDVISSVAFGVEAKAIEHSNSIFGKIGEKIMDPRRSRYQRLKISLTEILPEWILYSLKLRTGRADTEKFFFNWVKKLVDNREKNNIYRKDFMHLLIQLKNMNEVSDDGKISRDSEKQMFLSLEEITAQTFVFFTAGFETSSSTTSFALMHLALNQDIQDKAREEINRVLEKYDNQLSYQAIMDMEYLDQVVSETLRKTGATTVIRRVCNADYKVPNSDLIIEKGTLIRIPVYGLHHDPDHFPNPEKFDPDRFSPENKHKIPSYAYLPFGEGPRLCIGLRFGKLQVKVGLCTILKNYRVNINKKTKLPIKFEPQGLVPSIKGGLWLDLERI